MSLNSSSGSMTHHAKQQSMNAQRRNKNALKNDAKLNEVDELVGIPPNSNSIKDGVHDGVSYILDGYKIRGSNKGPHIRYIINKPYENLIQRVEKGTYFQIGGVVYQVTEMPILDGGVVEARMIVSKKSENISPRYTFTMKELLHSMIPENEVGHRLLADHSKYIEPLYMDKGGKGHATMHDVRLANDEIHWRDYPKTIKDIDSIIKI